MHIYFYNITACIYYSFYDNNSFTIEQNMFEMCEKMASKITIALIFII